MLREEQIDLRRQRARAEKFDIKNLTKKSVFSDFEVSNPTTGGRYVVGVRGFEVGDNTCTCPDYKSNTLGTCKHIEAVLEHLGDDVPPHVRQRKATVLRPEVVLDYNSEQLRLRLHLPARHSDALGDLARRFFAADLVWNPDAPIDEFISAVRSVPEHVSVDPAAMDFIDCEVDRRELARHEQEWLAALDRGQTPPALTDLLTVPLYEYQLRGAVFAACRGRSILGDDMGLGKTIQAMAAVEILARIRGIERVLVVAPASVKYQWETEITRFTQRSVRVVEGTPETRAAQYGEGAFYLLVNYEQVIKDLDDLNAWKPSMIILDEAQRIKNWESKTSRAVKKLRARYALVLTGTPLENKLEELYSIVQFVDDRRLGPAFQFLSDHRVLDESGRLIGYRHLDRIRDKLAPILLRRTRDQVLGQLPPRTENTVFVEMTPEQRAPYEEQRVSLARLLQKRVLSDLDRKRILSCLANLRMLCDSTFLVDRVTNHSPKLDEFEELVRELTTEGGHKLVVFSQWEQMIAKASEVLDRLGVGYAVLHGGVPARERRDVLERFRGDDACKVFLSTDAGGVGLNLQTADTVVNLEVPWNPAVLDQRIARVHRMGQERPVRVVNLVTRNSIEERVLRAVAQKRALFESVFDEDGDEVRFDALGQTGFLDTVRELVAEEGAIEPSPLPPIGSDPRGELLEASVRMLEAIAAVARAGQLGPIPAATVKRGLAALRALESPEPGSRE